MGDKLYSDAEIIAALEKTGGIQTDAAALLGCHRKTIWERAQESEAIREAIRGGLDELKDKAQAVVKEALDSQDEKIKVDTSKWVLGRLGKAIWSERQEIAGPDGAPLSVELLWPEMEGE